MNIPHLPHADVHTYGGIDHSDSMCYHQRVWKISTHTAAIGGVTGSLIAFSLLFNFNPMWWACLTLIVSGFEVATE